jgi:hypothetical protein
MLEVTLHRLVTQDQSFGDLPVRAASGDKSRYLELPWRQPAQQDSISVLRSA